MADTITTYIGNGTQTDFSVPFDYLKKSFVRVYVDNVLLTGGDYGDTTADYYFLDNTTVRLKTPPAVNIEITIRRYTSATERIVSFEDASILKATDLDTSQLQAFHIAEEARDIINDAMVKDSEGNWDAVGNRITNVGDPVDGGDAINLDWYNQDAGKVQENANLTEQWKEETKGYRDEAEGFRDDSEYYASQAQASAGIAVSVSGKAEVAYNNVVVLKKQVSDNAQQVDQQTQQVNQQSTTVNNQYNQIQEWTTENEGIQQDVTQKHSEVTEMYNTVVDRTDVVIDASEEIKIVANNIDDVKTTAVNIEDVNIVAGDLEGSIDVEGSTDMGMVGDPESPSISITGGNIKTVSDNIEDVQKVGDLIDSGQIETVLNAVETTTANVTAAQQAQQLAEAARDRANESDLSAERASGIAKNWANYMDSTVDDTEYSAKYYAMQAKEYAESAESTSTDVTEAVTAGVQQITQAGSTATTNINNAYDQATEGIESSYQNAVSEITTAKNSAVSAVTTEGNTQVGLVETTGTEEVAKVKAEGTTQVSNVNQAGETQVDAIDAAGVSHLNEINTAKTTAISEVNTAGTTQKKAVTDEGTKQVGLVTAEGNKQIPLVTTAGETAKTGVTNEGTKQVGLVTAEGTNQVAIIKTHVDKAQQWAEKTDGEVEAGKYSAKYWAEQASSYQLQANWSQTDSGARDFIKNKPDLSVYLTKTMGDQTYATKTELSNDISELATEVDTKANANDVYTKSEVDSKIASSIIVDYGLVGS